MLGLHMGVSLGAMAGGGAGPAPVAPVIVTPGSIDEQPLVGTQIALTEPNVTGADSSAYLWYNGDPDGGGTLISGVTSAVPTPADAIYGNDLWRRATYTNAVGSTVEKLHAPAIVGVIFTEDFSGFTVGNSTAEVLAAGWTRWSSATTQAWTADIISLVGGPSGKAMAAGCTTASLRAGTRNDWDAFFGANGWSSHYEYLALFVAPGDLANHGFRGRKTSAVISVADADLSAGTNLRYTIPGLCVTGESASVNPAAGVLPALTAGEKYFIRGQFAGVTSKVKIWLASAPEPVGWDLARDHSVTLVGRGISLYARTGPTDNLKVLWLACSGNTNAPFWPGFVPPVLVVTDPMTYAAPAPASSFAQNNSLITWTWEDAV